MQLLKQQWAIPASDFVLNINQTTKDKDNQSLLLTEAL